MQTRSIRIESDESLQEGVKKAAKVIQSGGVVAFPTESFYGLAVNAADEDAVTSLFLLKKRRSEGPILILIPSTEVVDQYAAHVPERARKLMEQFWPGGLTIVFDGTSNLSPLLTAETGKIGIRLSSHPIATALAGAAGVPITGTSANISGQPGCIRAGEVAKSLGEAVDLILDGGETKGGKGSTILDVTVDPPKVLREGIVELGQLEKFI